MAACIRTRRTRHVGACKSHWEVTKRQPAAKAGDSFPIGDDDTACAPSGPGTASPSAESIADGRAAKEGATDWLVICRSAPAPARDKTATGIRPRRGSAADRNRICFFLRNSYARIISPGWFAAGTRGVFFCCFLAALVLYFRSPFGILLSGASAPLVRQGEH